MDVRGEEVFRGLTRYAYLCAASYEDRVVGTARFVSQTPPMLAHVFHAQDCCMQIGTSVAMLQRLLPNVRLFATLLNDPLETARSIGRSVDELVDSGVREVLVDISTFTHEQLLILFRVLWLKRNFFSKLCCVYSHARDYSYDRAGEDKWLSKGSRCIRSIIGYPGRVIPGQPLALILLAGFEHERAVSVITQMEPNRLFVGIGEAANEEASWHHDSIERFSGLIRDFCAMREGVETYHFPSYDVEGTVKTLADILSRISDDVNVVVVPMNTKLSTLALFRVALTCDRIQLCYAQPDAYNVSAYSIEGGRLTFLAMT